MKRMIHPALAFAICCFWGVSLCLAPTSTSRPEESENIRKTIEALCRVVLADPLDTKAMAQLSELRRVQKQRRYEALDGLVEGLQRYVDDQPAGMRLGLRKALHDPVAMELTEQVLGIDLNQLSTQDGNPLGSDICPLCGDTGSCDCRKCKGIGVSTCATCSGSGIPRRARSRRQLFDNSVTMCTKCGGTGANPCTECKGQGFVRCRKCAQKAILAGSNTGIESKRNEKIKKLIAIARYLRDGGIDLYTPNALKCSPMIHNTSSRHED